MNEVPFPLLALLTGTRRIVLRRLAVDCRVGIHAFERAAAQRVLVDVDLYLADEPVGEDRIGQVLDYDFLRDGVHALVRGRRFNLQETLAEAVMALCLEPDAVLAARVATAKPDVYPDCERVGVELFRSKPGLRDRWR